MVRVQHLWLQNRKKNVVFTESAEVWSRVIVALTHSLSLYAPKSVAPPPLCLPLCSRLSSDVNQPTSQANPGEIEIHLQSCDLHQVAPTQLYRGSGRHNGGQLPNGRAEEITSQTPWGAPAVFREEHPGLLSVANVGWQRPVGGRGRMRNENYYCELKKKKKQVLKPQELLHVLIWP